MDFIEFLENEDKCQRQVIFDGNSFKVDGKIVFTVDRYGFIYSPGDDPAKKTVKYNISEITAGEWDILKNGYFSGYYFILQNQAVCFKSKELTAEELQNVTQVWGKKDKKRKKRNLIQLIIAAIGICTIFICMSISIFTDSNFKNALNNFSQSCNTSKYNANGTYYLKDNSSGQLHKKDYIRLDNGKFTDSSGIEGTYEISDGKIKFYVEMYGEETLFMTANIKDGKITYKISGIEYTYVKN